MFTLITPASRGRHKALLSRLFQTREGYYDSNLAAAMAAFDTPSSAYIVYEDPDNGVFGSARLNKLVESPAKSFYLEHYDERLLNTFLEVSYVSFTMEDDHPSQESSLFDAAIQTFYRELYDFLLSISFAQDLNGYVTLMDAEEHPDFIFFGNWHFERTHSVLLEGSPVLLGEIPLGTSIGYALADRNTILAA